MVRVLLDRKDGHVALQPVAQSHRTKAMDVEGTAAPSQDAATLHALGVRGGFAVQVNFTTKLAGARGGVGPVGVVGGAAVTIPIIDALASLRVSLAVTVIVTAPALPNVCVLADTALGGIPPPSL